MGRERETRKREAYIEVQILYNVSSIRAAYACCLSFAHKPLCPPFAIPRSKNDSKLRSPTDVQNTNNTASEPRAVEDAENSL
mmetsp:Transcript_80188/g.124942  ORF Transcript_80188/g.124942 Transcript_80188/m.124942 type:complete len:82 (+) Transcript_80188:158-403(+)